MTLEQIVTNSAVLIGLERIGKLELLPQVFPAIYAPVAVQNEVGLEADWLQIRNVENAALATSLKTQIGAGESEAIALAIELNGLPVLLDDKKARRIAQEMGLDILGTVGLLLRAKRQGVVPAIKPILDDLERVDFRLSTALRQRALQLAQEE